MTCRAGRRGGGTTARAGEHELGRGCTAAGIGPCRCRSNSAGGLMRVLTVVGTVLALAACSNKQAPTAPGGYISMEVGDKCTLTIVQPGNAPNVDLHATG